MSPHAAPCAARRLPSTRLPGARPRGAPRARARPTAPLRIPRGASPEASRRAEEEAKRRQESTQAGDAAYGAASAKAQAEAERAEAAWRADQAKMSGPALSPYARGPSGIPDLFLLPAPGIDTSQYLAVAPAVAAVAACATNVACATAMGKLGAELGAATLALWVLLEETGAIDASREATLSLIGQLQDALSMAKADDAAENGAGEEPSTKEAERALRTDRDFRRWFHREYKPDQVPQERGRKNPDLPPSLVREAYDEWVGMGKPKVK